MINDLLRLTQGYRSCKATNGGSDRKVRLLLNMIELLENELEEVLEDIIEEEDRNGIK